MFAAGLAWSAVDAQASPRGGQGSVGPRAGAVALTSAPPQTVELTLPFSGIWGVLQGMDSGDTHVGYAAYALDFVPAEVLRDAVPEGDRRRLTDFPCYGRPVLAPADGKVTLAHDGAVDHPPRHKIRRDPGNFVVIQHAPAEYTELRHLRSGSVLVKVGDRVVRGQRIAQCGNSGNAGTPHLHIGLLGSADPIATRPMRFSGYEVLGSDGSWHPGDGVPIVGQILRSVVDAWAKPSESPPKSPANLDGKL